MAYKLLATELRKTLQAAGRQESRIFKQSADELEKSKQVWASGWIRAGQVCANGWRREILIYKLSENQLGKSQQVGWRSRSKSSWQQSCKSGQNLRRQTLYAIFVSLATLAASLGMARQVLYHPRRK
jgi:hypothetical protein